MKSPGLPLKTAFLVAAALATGCGAPEGGRIAVTLYTSAPAGNGGIRGEVPAHIYDTITDFRICVSVPGMNDIRCKNFNLEKYKSGGKARIDDLSVGKDRRVTFQGYDMTTWDVIWCGEVSGVEVRKDATTQVSMFVSACRGFCPTRNPMRSPRVFHTATRLPDGRVLIVGGFSILEARANCDAGTCRGLSVDSDGSKAVDIYDPRTGEFDDEFNLSLEHPRGLHTATLLSDGRVLVAGGCEGALIVDDTQGAGPLVQVEDWGMAGVEAEIVDPVGLAVDPIDSTILEPRAGHAALSLPSGDVFLLGGIGATGPDDSALKSGAYYRASSGTFEPASRAMEVSRQGFALIPYGSEGTHALVWGGNHPTEGGPGVFAELLSVNDGGEVELEKPTFVTDLDQKHLGIPAFHAAGAQISTGDVLVTGGIILDQLYDPVIIEPRISTEFRLISTVPGSEQVTTANGNGRMGFFAAFHTATLLGRRNKVDGEEDYDFKVLVAGGYTPAQAIDLLFKPQDEVRFFQYWATEGSLFPQENDVKLTEPRAGHTATALDDGTVLFTGGFTDGAGGLAITSTAEVFNAAPRELRAE